MEKNETPIVMNSKKISKEILSPDKTKVLQLTYVEDMNPRKTFNYKVLSSKGKKELKSGVFEGVKLDWNDNNSLKGFLYQGIVPTEGNSGDSQNYKIITLKK